MKKRSMELIMACLMLVCFFVLAREAAVTASQPSRDPVIVIDPGHGGEDPGMLGVGGLKEKGINLAVAWKLKEILQEQGFSVVMTREEDTCLCGEDARNKKAQDMQKRIAIIEEASPLLTVSIHQNSYQDPEVFGPQVFYYTDSAEGEALAGFLQEELNQGLSIKRPRKEKGNKTYYLLKKSKGVLAIVECGFLTNPEEAALLQEEKYQKKVAEAIARGIGRYLEKKN